METLLITTESFHAVPCATPRGNNRCVLSSEGACGSVCINKPVIPQIGFGQADRDAIDAVRMPHALMDRSDAAQPSHSEAEVYEWAELSVMPFERVSMHAASTASSPLQDTKPVHRQTQNLSMSSIFGPASMGLEADAKACADARNTLYHKLFG